MSTDIMIKLKLDEIAGLRALARQIQADLAAERAKVVALESENERLREMWQEEHDERVRLEEQTNRLEESWSRLRDQYDHLLNKYLDKRNEEVVNG